MKLVETRNAAGHVLCHDLTQIIPGIIKDARFRKGHVITPEDIPVLLSMGKEHLYIWEAAPGCLHEDDAAQRLLKLCQNSHMRATPVKEGKNDLLADCDGLFQVDVGRLNAINNDDEIIIATRHTNTAVKKGDKLAGTRIIPLVINEKKIEAAEAVAKTEPLLALHPWKRKTCGIITTGNEVAGGLIKDAFTPVLKEKLAAYGVEVTAHCLVGDDQKAITDAALNFHAQGISLILCTGGMSVDPDDRTPAAIRETGARIVSYGAPVLPGAMLLLGYFDNGVPVLGLPGCVMYAKATIFDLLLPCIIADIPISREQIKQLGHGGLCLSCDTCHYPVCSFGKGGLI